MSIARLTERLGDPEISETVLPDGSGVLLDIEGRQVLSLSKTGVFLVHELRAGATTLDELSARLTTVYQVDPDTAREDTIAFLARLGEALLVS
jgi:hypothetical protein